MSVAPSFTRAAAGFLAARPWWWFLPAPLTVATLAIYRGPFQVPGGSVTTYTAGGLVVATSLLLLTLRRWEPGLLVVLCLAGGVLSAAVPPSWTVVLPYLVSALAARRYRLLPGAFVVAAGTVGIVINQLARHGGWVSVLAALATMAALTLASLARRSRVDRLEQMQLALAREQAAHEEHARAAALAERARIAREVHDVLAHSLSALSLNLQGARLMLANEGASEQAQEQVVRAQRLAAEGLAEARRAIAALRDDPVPAARAIADLVTGVRLETGARIAFRVEGNARDLPGSAEDALFRTAREALSNTRKHAPGAPVDVLLAYHGDSTELTVTDHQGRRPSGPATGGYGLTGMRERAELIGGELTTGPTDDGWRVRLVVPSVDRGMVTT